MSLYQGRAFFSQSPVSDPGVKRDYNMHMCARRIFSPVAGLRLISCVDVAAAYTSHMGNSFTIDVSTMQKLSVGYFYRVTKSTCQTRRPLTTDGRRNAAE